MMARRFKASILPGALRNKAEFAAAQAFERRQVNVASLLPSGPTGGQHLGIGTNFPEHAEEANSDAVFNFPKFGTATPARTSVIAPEGGLLDYEVELCMRFDRPITSIEDFDAAVKGVFLCADFTDRIKLLKLAAPDNLDSGYGYRDAISVRFSYRNTLYTLAPNARIEQDMTLMSGTSEGGIFTVPQRHDYIEIVIGYALNGGPFSGKDLMGFAVDAFIQSEIASGHFLQPGDVVTYQASGLGDISVEIVSAEAR